MEAYTKVRILGKGAFGAAWLIQRKKDNAQYVAKEVKLTTMKPSEKEDAKHEIKMLRKLNHPNITKYVDHFEHMGSLYIVMEYANGGDLYTKIKNRRNVKMSEAEVMRYFTQILMALKHLHDNRILHRDLKTQNIFLTKDGVVKMGDFGISTVLRNTYELKRTVCGTPYYFSPELCLNKAYNNKSDVWALGCILYELATLTHAFDGNNMKGLVNNILKGIYKPIGSTYSKELSDLIRSMLQNDPAKRPNVNQILGCGLVKSHLAKLSNDAQTANADHRSLVNQDDRAKEKADAQARVLADLALRKKREEAGLKAEENRKKEADDRVAKIRAQMAAEQKAHEAKMKAVRERQQLQDQQRAQRQKENEEKNRARREEDKKLQEQRAAVQRKANAVREAEWEKNMKQQQEDNRRRQEEAARHAQHAQDQQRANEQRREEDRIRREQAQAVDAAAMYKQMRREAAANRAKAADAEREEVARQQQQQQQYQQQQQQQQYQPQAYAGQPEAVPQQRRQPTAEEMEKARADAYWQMRREAENNKRRLQGLDPLPDPNAAPQQPQPEPVVEQQQYVQQQPQQYGAQQYVPEQPVVQQQQQYAPEPQPPVHQVPPPVAQEQQFAVHAPEQPAEPEVEAEDEEVGLRRFLNDDCMADNDGDFANVSREADYSNMQAAIAQAQEVDPNQEQDFEEVADTDPTHFFLEGQTLMLPNAGQGDPLMSRIESLRLFLEASLGEELFYQVYRILDSTSEDDNESCVQEVERLLAPVQHKYIPVITQLLVCEEFFNQQANQ